MGTVRVIHLVPVAAAPCWIPSWAPRWQSLDLSSRSGPPPRPPEGPAGPYVGAGNLYSCMHCITPHPQPGRAKGPNRAAGWLSACAAAGRAARAREWRRACAQTGRVPPATSPAGSHQGHRPAQGSPRRSATRAQPPRSGPPATGPLSSAMPYPAIRVWAIATTGLKSRRLSRERPEITSAAAIRTHVPITVSGENPCPERGFSSTDRAS